MADEYAWTIRGSQPRNEEERRKRKIFLGYLEALLEPVDMKSRFATSFWPHDLLAGDQRPPEGAGIEAMEQFRERINSACTSVRSATVTWIEDGAALSMLAGGADPADLVGASMVVTYVHDRGPLVLPGSDRVYEPTGKDLVLDGSDAVRIDSDGIITDRWSGLSFAHLHWQLEQNALPIQNSSRLPRPAVWSDELVAARSRFVFLLGYHVSAATVRRSLRARRRSPAPPGRGHLLAGIPARAGPRGARL